MNLLEILSSKSHNAHYLNRYIKFIEHCKNKQTIDGYTEIHHICPRADDLFPEYKDLRIHRWNSIELTARQHIVAHIILWKTYGKSQYLAAYYMLNVQNSSTIKFNNRDVPKSIDIRYAAKLREEFSNWRKGKSTYKDSSGAKYFLLTNDPLISELNLVGNNTGIPMSEESKQSMRDAKFSNKVIEIYFLNYKKTVKLFSDEFDHHINQGWTTEYLSADREYSQNIGRKKHGTKIEGKVRYATPDGVFYGLLYRNDPDVKKLNLVYYATDKNRAQWAKRSEAATEFRTGTNLYTNGVDEIFANEPPDDTWKLGRKPRSVEWENKRKAASGEKTKGSKTYTNGTVNMPILEGEIVPEGFYLGMKQRPNTVYSYTNETKTTLVQFTGSHEVPKDLIRIKGTALINSIKKKLD